MKKKCLLMFLDSRQCFCGPRGAVNKVLKSFSNALVQSFACVHLFKRNSFKNEKQLAEISWTGWSVTVNITSAFICMKKCSAVMMRWEVTLGTKKSALHYQTSSKKRWLWWMTASTFYISGKYWHQRKLVAVKEKHTHTHQSITNALKGIWSVTIQEFN